jgi:vacuolar protein sorting-associated protein 29
MSTELVLILSDILIPLKSPSIDSQFKSILLPNKINHLLCLGNIGNQDTLYWLQSLSPDVHIIKGDYDIYQNYPEKKVIQIGSFRLGMIHGHQILPPGNMDALSGIQSELDCDILLSGFTYKYGINIKENKLFMNPGSITGGLSPLMEDTYPSFILMAITDDEMTIYSYMLTDKNEKFQVGQMEYKKGSNEIKVIQEIKLEEDEEEENKEDINNNNKENNENNINNEEKKNLEEKPKEEENNNINNINNEEENNKNEVILDNKPQIQNNENQEVKEEENQDIKENEIKDDKIDE